MTVDHDKTENPAPADVQVDVAAPAPMISRRMLLRGASAAVPTILTLNSGVAAAAAAASNMIATNSNAEPATFRGETGHMCLKFDGEMTRIGSKINLGDPPIGGVQPLPRGEWKRHQSDAQLMKAYDVCNEGGEFVFKPASGGGWQPVRVGQGALLSNGALTSFSSGLTITHIEYL